MPRKSRCSTLFNQMDLKKESAGKISQKKMSTRLSQNVYDAASEETQKLGS
jgi:hypothetical protein